MSLLLGFSEKVSKFMESHFSDCCVMVTFARGDPRIQDSILHRSYIAEFLVAANVSCLKLHLLETDKLKLLTVFCHLTPPLEYLAWPSARLSRGILIFAEHSLMFTSHKSDQGRDEE